MTQGWHLECRD